MKNTSRVSFSLFAFIILVLFSGVSFAATTQWSFSSQEDYQLSDQGKLEVTGGVVRLKPLAARSVDNAVSGFGAGAGIQSLNGVLELAAEQTSAVFTSPVKRGINWTNISWTPAAPYTKELPDNGGRETAYRQGNIDMSGCVLLMHLNDKSAVQGAAIADSCGEERNGVLTTNEGAANKSTSGKFQQALRFDGVDDHIAFTLPAAGTEVTAAAWFKREGIPGNKFHIILGPATLEISVPDGWSVHHDGKIRVGITTADNIRHVFNSGTKDVVTDGNWHHLALTYNGSKLIAYIDGQKTGEQNVSGALKAYSQTIGKIKPTSAYAANGLIDEVAIWSRCLSADDILNLYKRGALSLKLQVRAGNSYPLAGNYMGPDGTAASYFTESANNVVALPAANLTGFSGKTYFQYQVLLETDDKSFSPQLADVTVDYQYYAVDDPCIINKVAAENFSALTKFSDILGTNNQGDVRYQVSADGSSWYYHDGEEWTAASGYEQTNSADQIDANSGSFALTAGKGDFYFKAFLHSDGIQVVELDEVSLQNTPYGSLVCYLAEGATSETIDEWLLIQNPNTDTAQVQLAFLAEEGLGYSEEITIAPESRYTLRVNELIPAGSCSVIVKSLNGVGINAERAMYWGDNWYGGHCSLAATEAASCWYLAEGSTNGFSEYIALMNPGEEEAEVTFTFMLPEGVAVERDVTIAANSRYTMCVNDIPILQNKDVSVKVEAKNDTAIVTERAMYWSAEGVDWIGGHCTLGATASATDWYFAEGCTDGFDQYLLILNPGQQIAQVEARFFREDGQQYVERMTVQPESRYTICANGVISGSSFSTQISSVNGVGVVAERAMYWCENQGPDVQYEQDRQWIGGHCSLGMTTADNVWYLAEGSTASDFDQWILLLNTNSYSADVQLTYMQEDGTRIYRTVTIPARSRYSVHANALIPKASFSVKIESVNDEDFFIERTMYWGDGIDGHCTMGAR